MLKPTPLVPTLRVSSVRLKFRTTKVSLIGRVDKRSASTIPAYFGGCATLIHPTKKRRVLIAVMIN